MRVPARIPLEMQLVAEVPACQAVGDAGIGRDDGDREAAVLVGLFVSHHGLALRAASMAWSRMSASR